MVRALSDGRSASNIRLRAQAEATDLANPERSVLVAIHAKFFEFKAGFGLCRRGHGMVRKHDGARANGPGHHDGD